MERPTTLGLQGRLEAPRRQFLEAVRPLRPKLHRFCARMCGSALDGEDLVQETLAQAFFNLSSLHDESKLEGWLFRIAHHKCIDHLRRERSRREGDVPLDETPEIPAALDATEPEPVDGRLATLVGALPPKERAAVLLKDVLDYPLAGVAEMVDSTVGGVKAALHRARGKLRTVTEAPRVSGFDAPRRELLEAYVTCFNQRDWAGLERLIRADATLEVLDRYAGAFSEAGYTERYAELPWRWRLSVGEVDGEPVVLHLAEAQGAWRPRAALRLWWVDRLVSHLRDYVHVDYLLEEAKVG